jgi:two-component system response regulator FixJ
LDGPDQRRAAHRAPDIPGSVAILDDDAAIRDSLGALLAALGWRVASFATEDAFTAWRGDGDAEVVILDVKLGSGIDGVTLLERLRSTGDTIPVIIVTGQPDIPVVLRALRAGAIDVLEKPYALASLLAALGEARAETPIARRATALVARLGQRERRVLAGLAAGWTNLAVAESLGLPPRGVEADRAAIMHKLGVQSFFQALRIAIAAGLEADPAS